MFLDDRVVAWKVSCFVWHHQTACGHKDTACQVSSNYENPKDLSKCDDHIDPSLWEGCAVVFLQRKQENIRFFESAHI